jgi:hypothetical protein
MKKETVRTLTILAGLVVLLIVLGLGSALWLFTQAVDVGNADASTADEEFSRVVARFQGVKPVLEIRDEHPVLIRRPPDAPSDTRLGTLHVLHWDPDDDSFTRIHVPFWLIRLKSGTIEINADRDGVSSRDLGLTVEELERFGPTLVIDHQGRAGVRLLVWTE